MAQKIIVTHISPDFDGIPAIWLLKRYHPEFSDARVEFVPAGDNTLNREPVDSDADIVHVDVGGGRFDHHHSDKFTSGAQLVYEWLVDEGYIDKEDNAIARMVKVITELEIVIEDQPPEKLRPASRKSPTNPTSLQKITDEPYQPPENH